MTAAVAADEAVVIYSDELTSSVDGSTSRSKLTARLSDGVVVLRYQYESTRSPLLHDDHSIALTRTDLDRILDVLEGGSRADRR